MVHLAQGLLGPTEEVAVELVDEVVVGLVVVVVVVVLEVVVVVVAFVVVTVVDAVVVFVVVAVVGADVVVDDAHWHSPLTLHGHQVCKVPDPQGEQSESFAA